MPKTNRVQMIAVQMVCSFAHKYGCMLVRAPAFESPQAALIVEIGCSFGSLLRQFALPERTLVCFEPTRATAMKAEAELKASRAADTPAY